MIDYKEKKPSLEEFKKLRKAVNWSLEDRLIADERAEDSLSKSPLCICAYDNKKIIGMIRIAGDLSMYGYIQDFIVLPEYQGRSIGKRLLEKLFEKIKNKKGYLLGVCPSKVSVELYQKFGFEKRPENPNGFMSIEF